MPNRAERWQEASVPLHLRLIDADLDATAARFEKVATNVEALEGRLTAKMEAGFARCDEASRKNNKLLVGLLVSIVASCVVITYTILTATQGGG